MSNDTNSTNPAEKHVGAIDLKTHLPYRLAVLSNTIKQSTTDHYVRGTKMSPREWRVLGMIALNGPITAARAAELTGMDRATITRAMAKLMELNYAEKRPNQEDGRSQLLYLTHEGTKKCDDLIPQMSEDGEFYKQLLSTEELTLLLSIIERFQTSAKQRLHTYLNKE